MTDYLFCKFFERGAGVLLEARGTYVCESASGTELLNMIGDGKVTIPAYDDMIRSELARVQNGDICVCWTTAPRGSDFPPLHVATFLVETRQYKDGRYEISGPDLLGELAEYMAIAPVGQGTEVVTTALSLGTRTVNHPPPTDDTYEVLDASYGPRIYVTAEVAGPHQDGSPRYNKAMFARSLLPMGHSMNRPYAMCIRGCTALPSMTPSCRRFPPALKYFSIASAYGYQMPRLW
jgi:hypothetical protein